MKKYFFFSFAAVLILGSIGIFSFVYAQSDPYGLRATAEEAGIKPQGQEQDISTLVGNVIGTALSMVAVLFFVLMIYGGILWMTARGDDGQTKKAFDTITAAVIGIAIVLSSYAITTFAFNTLGKSGGNSGTRNTIVTPQCGAKGAGFECRPSFRCAIPTIQTDISCSGGDDVVCCQAVSADTEGEVGPPSPFCTKRDDCGDAEVCLQNGQGNKECKGTVLLGDNTCCIEDGVASEKGSENCAGYFFHVTAEISCPLPGSGT